MRFNLVGKLHRKGKSKKTGNDFDFYELHYTGPAAGVTGEGAGTVIVDSTFCSFEQLQLGVYNAEFDAHGHLLALTPIQK